MTEQQLYVKRADVDEAAGPDLEPLVMLMRFVAGCTLEGMDELVRLIRERQEALEQQLVTQMTVRPGEETELERWRYALFGLLAEAPAAIRKRVAGAEQRANRAGRLFSRLTRPVTNSRLVRPLQRRYARLAAERSARFERLIEIGRIEEQLGREMAREVGNELVGELLAYLAERPELLQLVQQQSASLTGELVGRLRQRTATADDWMDRLAGGARRRSGAQPPPAPELPLYPAPPAETGQETK